MRRCHLAALVRDDSVLNGRFRRGHTAFALALVADMTDILARATRRELDARSFVTGKTCYARSASASTSSSAMLAGMNRQKECGLITLP